MKHNLFKGLVACFITCSFMTCNQPEKPLRVATYTYATNDRIDNLRPFADALEKTLNKPVEIKSFPDVESFIEGIKSDQVDIGFINTLGYLLLALNNENMEPVATLRVKEDAVDNYKTVLLSRSEGVSDLKSLQDNSHDLTMMFVAPGSTSGNLVPRLLMSSLGIDHPENQFKKITYGGNHTSTFNKLIEGETDLCAIGSNEYFKQVNADTSLLSSTRLLWTSEEIPLGPILLNKRFTSSEKERITKLILGLHDSNAAALVSIKDGWSEAKQAEKFYPITDSYYDSFRMVNGDNTDLANILTLFLN